MENLKKLGFGCMRLPLLDEDVTHIDYETLNTMFDRFLAEGFTYVDTAFPYHQEHSEEAVRECLVKRHPRDSFLLADKMPVFKITKAEEYPMCFQKQLERCGVEYFDYYLLHNLWSEAYDLTTKLGGFEFIQKLKAEGKAKKVGFSFHDTAPVLDRILTDHPEVDFVQLQINYSDWESASIQSRACYEVARKHGKPIIIMEPVKGGSLANLPAHVAKPLTDLDAGRSLSSWALRFAASLPGVLTVLSGMSDLGQVDDNTRTLAAVQPLTQEERQALLQVVENLKTTRRVPCTDCHYCVKGCPQGVKIPAIFDAYNTYLVYNHLEGARGSYRMRTQDGGGARNCIACGACEEVCPQKIDIIRQLREAADVLEPQA